MVANFFLDMVITHAFFEVELINPEFQLSLGLKVKKKNWSVVQSILLKVFRLERLSLCRNVKGMKNL